MVSKDALYYSTTESSNTQTEQDITKYNIHVTMPRIGLCYTKRTVYVTGGDQRCLLDKTLCRVMRPAI